MFGHTCVVSAFPSLIPGDLSSFQLFSFHWTEWRNLLLLICVLHSTAWHHILALKHISPQIKRSKAGGLCHPRGPVSRLPKYQLKGAHSQPRKQSRPKHCCLLTAICISQVGCLSFQGIFRFVSSPHYRNTLKGNVKGQFLPTHTQL